MTEEVPSPKKKDKVVVTDEWFTQEMLASFLRVPAPSEDDDDFRRLLFAFRGMPLDAFERFVALFVESGHNILAKDVQGRTFAKYLERFEQQKAYLKVVQDRMPG